MCAFALPAEQAEDLDWFGAGGAEPVRHASVEFGSFARCEHQIVFAKDEPQTSIEHVQPLIAFVNLRLGFPPAAASLDHELERLDPARPPRQGHHSHAVPGGHGPQVDARVCSRGRVDEFIERHVMRSREREQEFESRAAVTRLQSGQCAYGYARRRREVGECRLALPAQSSEPRSD